jgi:hypothetical protein
MADRYEVLDETTGNVVATDLTKNQAEKVAGNVATSHTVKVQAAAEAPETG